MTISFAELEHSAFEMSRYISQESVLENTVTSNPEDSRMSGVSAKSPRTSIASTFCAGVAKIASRVIVWVREVRESLKPEISVSSYRKECSESLRAIKTAIQSKNPEIIKAQFMRLAECRSQQVNFLKSVDKSVASKFDEDFYKKFDVLVNRSREKLDNHSRLMELKSVTFHSWIPRREDNVRLEYCIAHKTIKTLLENAQHD